jgi:uncharacterized membrane protein YkvI
MFIVFGYIIMDLGRKLNSKSHLEIIKYTGGKTLGIIFDAIITFFLFGFLTAMIAGTGALFNQQFNLPSIVGNITMGVLTAITVLTGISGVISSISFVVPFLLVSVIGISVYSIINAPPHIFTTAPAVGNSVLITNWLLSAVLYVSYNIILSIAVLGPLGVKAQNKKAIRNGAILGGLGLGLGSIMIFLALSINITDIARLEVPMIYIAGSISSVLQIAYSIILIAEVYTTAVASLYGFVSRIIDIEKPSTKVKAIVIGSMITAVLASQFGFTNLVKYLYPLVGYGGIVLLGSLIYIKFKKNVPMG